MAGAVKWYAGLVFTFTADAVIGGVAGDGVSGDDEQLPAAAARQMRRIRIVRPLVGRLGGKTVEVLTYSMVAGDR